MKKIQVKKQYFWYDSPLIALGIVVLVILVGISVIRFKQNYDRARDRYLDQQEQLQRVQEQEAKLEEDLMFFRTDRGKEELIRTQFPVVRDGEEMILFIDESKGLQQ
ncbi:MAG: hypothetical protein LRY41_00965 [Candidatus Pacebacteria bacterium]|nr:hypothetical protein [Candidatus Paceibacterota bacterium]MCD8507798.1 hypothetical protein [Candidatus Paceibacterota bacterium]MCD8527891.1 hypothetical protein [Candidatus Paceibacterota bacterium]MCD8563557.1 hypothetical protein [Candidatus Paceibacterota bacterium]